MPYHINAEGEVGSCSARIRCPFGDFDNEHYTTKEEAQRAYQAAMSGKTFSPGLSKDPQMREFEKFKDKKLKKLEKMLKKKKIVPPQQEVGVGYFASSNELLDAKTGQELFGGVVVQARRNNAAGVKVFTVDYDSEGELKIEAPIDNNGDVIPDKDVWVNKPDPEAALVREMEVAEYNLHTATEFILSDVGRAPNPGYTTFFYRDKNNGRAHLNWDPKGETAKWMRLYKSMVDDAKKSGIANPHNFALQRWKKTHPETSYLDHEDFAKFRENGEALTARLTEAIITQNDSYELRDLDLLILNQTFDDGEAPFLDYDFKDLGLKKFE